jgi:hypothetical protein
MYQQINSVMETLSKEGKPRATRAIKEIAARPPTEADLNQLISQQLSHYDFSRVLTDETYRNHVVPKAVGNVLKIVNYSVEGEKVAERIYMQMRERMRGNDK